MSTVRAQHTSLYKGNAPGPKDSGIFCKAAVRALIEHGPEDGDVRASAEVRRGNEDRTRPNPNEDPYAAEASRILDAALARAGATKADLGRALGKGETWARKLTDPNAAPTLSFAGFLRLRETAPSIFAAIKRTIDILSAPAPLHAPEVVQQRRILARSFAELMAADDGPATMRASERHHEALDGFDAAVAKEAASCR
jgi:hypothetical protein